MKKNIRLNFIQLLLIVIIPVIMISIISGSLVFMRLNENPVLSNNRYIKEFVNTYNKLLDEYYEDLDESKLIDAAISGMLDYTGDDYSIHLNEDATDMLNEKLDGVYEGIGVRIGLNENNEVYIFEVFDETPAKNVGIRVGDVIISVNGENVLQKDIDYISSIIKDSKESKFVLEVKRNGEIKTFEVERKKLIVPAVRSSIKEVNNKKVGYIFLETFSSTLDTQVETTLISMENEGIDSLIIDLRNNTGGYLTSCTNIIELFLEKDKLMYTIKSKKSTETFKDTTANKREYPIVVIINGSTASASEMLAASLKYSYGATIIGNKSFGKGKVQTTEKLEDGTMFKYTSARWYMPNGECIDEKGITPDIEVSLDDVYVNNPIEENDTQINKAIEILTKN